MFNLKRKKLGLERYKKTVHGVIEFACLIEQADPANREKILRQAAEEDADFLHQVMKKVVFFEELTFIDEGILAEILSKTSPKILAFALHGMPEEYRNKILKQIGFRELRQFKDEEEKFGTAPARALILGAQSQILKIARQLEEQNIFLFELTDCPRFKLRKKRKRAEVKSATA